MTQISFYLIEKQDIRQEIIACRLSQKILNKHYQPIWIQCQSEDHMLSLDDLLWNFDETSFLPHGQNQLHAPICLSIDRPNISFNLCINFSGQAINVTELPHADIHIIEIVGHNEADKIKSREVFKHYRNLGFEPKVHKI